MMNLMKKQFTLFLVTEVPIIQELDPKRAEEIAAQVKVAVEIHCCKIEVAGSIRRQKAKVHGIDFVVVSQSDVQWQKINEKLRQLKAKPICSGNSVIKAFVPCEKGLFQADFYNPKPTTFGIHLLVRTGSADQKIWLDGHAISKGLRIKYSEGLNPGLHQNLKSRFHAFSFLCSLHLSGFVLIQNYGV